MDRHAYKLQLDKLALEAYIREAVIVVRDSFKDFRGFNINTYKLLTIGLFPTHVLDWQPVQGGPCVSPSDGWD